MFLLYLLLFWLFYNSWSIKIGFFTNYITIFTNYFSVGFHNLICKLCVVADHSLTWIGFASRHRISFSIPREGVILTVVIYLS